MKRPKAKKAYCKTCKKHSEHKVAQVKAKGRSATHPLSWGSAKRRKAKVGFGNHGKYSKPPVAKFKRTGAKTSKKTELKLTCQECKKSSIETLKRAKKVELE
tara:strand:+ start:270 stop:575 length:306 start_codon:yes stop_codon:yes gene_type:complete